MEQLRDRSQPVTLWQAVRVVIALLKEPGRLSEQDQRDIADYLEWAKDNPPRWVVEHCWA